VTILQISLKWFRGASSETVLDSEGKSVVIYGPNGAGKSTFTDAMEYIATGGRICHLAHEYSGKCLEKGVKNTHTPKDEASAIRICFDQNRAVEAQIKPNGKATFKGSPPEFLNEIQSWPVERFILRQDELAAFVLKSKGEKYSVLLPLLGLGHLENAAENLRKLRDRIEKRSKLAIRKDQLCRMKETVLKNFSSTDCEVIQRELGPHTKHLGVDKSLAIPDLLAALESAVTTRIEQADPIIRIHAGCQDLLKEGGLDDKLTVFVQAKQRATQAFNKVISKRLEILEKTSEFLEALKAGKADIECPACGRVIRASELTNHVQAELEKLHVAREAASVLEEASSSLAVEVKSAIKILSKEELKSWLAMPEQADCVAALDALQRVDVKMLRHNPLQVETADLEEKTKALLKHLKSVIAKGPPSTKELLDARDAIGAAKVQMESAIIQDLVIRIETLLQALQKSEEATRETIRKQSNAILTQISAEVQRLWRILHPDELIESVHLYAAPKTDKAIDIGLKFYGVDQPSPRLTLSEGHRNSLGLCIFLALTKLERDKERFIILDDIVSSLDRGHRGMVADLLTKEFSNHQIIMFTHDREWYTELRARLPANNWIFKAVKPWNNPRTGIAWAAFGSSFLDARALIPQNVEAAGNRVRAAMDTELSIAIEKLQVKLPYRRGDKNDQRGAVEFLEALISEGPHRFKIKTGEPNKYSKYDGASSIWDEAKRLIITWGNRSSHTGSLIKKEAEKLAEVCEQAVEAFKCDVCGDTVWISNQASRKRLQCSCGKLRWKYD